jgi:hypothetical protein
LRKLTLLALVAAVAIPGPATATIFVITGGIETDGTQPARANLADCRGSRELTFVWSVANIPLTDSTDIEIRSTTASGTSCQMGSTSDSCEIRLASQRWDRITPIRVTYTLSSFFQGERNNGCTGSGTRQVSLFLEDSTVNPYTGQVDAATESKLEFPFDVEPPAVPASPTAVSADKGLRVSWPGAGADAGVIKYRLWWSTNSSLLTGYPSCGTGSYRSSCQSSDQMTATEYRVSGLTNGETVYVAVSAVDDYGNETVVSGVASGVPMPVSDFFQQYVDAGGQERGGYCFVATAAYGSSWHPLVGSLRRFRDQVLLKTELGRDLISFYRDWSPALAEVLDDSPWLRTVFRVALLPVAVLAWFLVDTAWWAKILILAALWGAWRLGRRRRRWRQGIALALAIAILGASASARAESPRNFYLELKIGAVGPNLDDRPGLGTTRPYATIFGTSSRLAGGFELEWQILKEVGSFGVSFGLLYFQSVGKGIRPDTGERSSDTTVLNVLPFQVNAVYRMDIPMRRWGIPLVPYAKFGFDYYLWWTMNGAGDISQATDPGGGTRRGAGGTFGLHFALGMQFQLDVIDRRMQKAFDEDVGINHSYLFAEVVFSRVDDFNDRSFNFSSTYFLAGLALEF